MMVNDLLASDLTWKDLERHWMELASPEALPLVPTWITNLWRLSAQRSETETFELVLAATVLLAEAGWRHGLGEIQTMT